MSTHYRSEYNKLKVAIGKQIEDALGKDSDGAKQLKKNVFNKIFYANTLGTGSDPKLELTLATAGFGHKTIGVASANIGKVKGVATANIGKVIGVD